MVSLLGGTEKYRLRFFNLSEKFTVQKKTQKIKVAKTEETALFNYSVSLFLPRINKIHFIFSLCDICGSY